ncbi:NAD-dependent epimerase/dehydratase family protein [Altererythrobacter sp. CAU 1778]
MTIALTGATGFVGQAVLDEATRRGLTVRALTRRTQSPRERVDWIHGDLDNRRALARLCRGVEAVIHVAGVVNAPDKAGFERGNVTGTLNLVETALAAGVPRFVHVSSLSAREPQLSAYGASKRRAEKLVAASGLDWTIVRPPAIYGPRDREILELFKLAKLGVVPMPQEGRDSLLHVDDLARLLLDLIPSREEVTHEIFEPDDGTAGGWARSEWARAIGKAVGKDVRVPQMSKATLSKLSAAERLFRGSKAKLTADRVDYMVHPDWTAAKRRAVPPRIWQPRIETREGLKATADWYRQQGWL